jgi:hypothetical protein
VPAQPQPVVPQPGRTANHVVPEPEADSGEESSGTPNNEKEEEGFDDQTPPEKPAQQQQQAEPGKGRGAEWPGVNVMNQYFLRKMAFFLKANVMLNFCLHDLSRNCLLFMEKIYLKS